jgi:hypothetical protein
MSLPIYPKYKKIDDVREYPIQWGDYKIGQSSSTLVFWGIFLDTVR